MPAFMRYDSTLAARFHVKRRKWVTLVNQNALLMQYRGGIGGKIGWTDRARATYIGLARRHGVTLIVTILHAVPLTEITSGERLLNWGFAMDRKVRAVGTLVSPLAGHPPGGSGRTALSWRLTGRAEPVSRGRPCGQPSRPWLALTRAARPARSGLAGTGPDARHPTVTAGKRPAPGR